jgi:hypothetical protein
VAAGKAAPAPGEGRGGWSGQDACLRARLPPCSPPSPSTALHLRTAAVTTAPKSKKGKGEEPARKRSTEPAQRAGRGGASGAGGAGGSGAAAVEEEADEYDDSGGW